MEFESPADAWYVWAGVALGSMLVAGIVLELPTQPPPDATRVANTIDSLSTNTYEASATIEHEADVFKFGTKRISMRNDGGIDHASLAFATLTPVSRVQNQTRQRTFRRMLEGEPPESVTDVDAERLVKWVQTVQTRLDENGRRWRQADGQMYVRMVTLDGQRVVLVDFDGSREQ